MATLQDLIHGRIDDFLPEVQKIDLTPVSTILANSEYKQYFLQSAGTEHYKLLSYVASLFNGQTIYDIGTYHGMSSVALSAAGNTKVVSYDIAEMKQLYSLPENVDYRIGDFRNDPDVLSSPFIFVDVDPHDGVQERIFHQFFLEKGYKGVVLWDDIHVNTEMKQWWNSVTEPNVKKIDVSKLGHWSGTGMIIYNPDITTDSEVSGLDDPELQAIADIIITTSEINMRRCLASMESDKIFLDRMQRNPQALKIGFWEQHFELNSFTEYPEIQGRILDFGCGSGHLDLFLARRGHVITGIDQSPVGIAIASYNRSKEQVDVQHRLNFSLVDVTVDLPVGEKYDSIWSAHVFEHIKDPTQVFKGLRRWIKPDGYILISVPLGHAYDDPDHVNHFNDIGELCDYLKKHVIIERVKVHQDNQVIRALCKF